MASQPTSPAAERHLRTVGDPRPWRLLLLVPLLVSLVLFVVPQYVFISTSFHENLGYGRIGDAFTLANYQRVFTDPVYLGALLRTAMLAAATAGVCLVLGFPVAYVLARARSRWVALLLGLLLAATFITPVVKDLGLVILMSQSGALNALLAGIGLVSAPVRWLGSEVGVVVGLVHYTLPLLVLLLHTVIQTVPRSLEDAAHAHGASRLRVFHEVIIPIVRPGLVAAMLMVFNLAMGAFTTPVLLGGGRIITLPILIQRSVILDVDFPFAASLSTVLLVFVFALNLVAGYQTVKQFRLPRARRHARAVPAAPAIVMKQA